MPREFQKKPSPIVEALYWMSDGPGQLGTVNALIYTSDAPRGHRIALSTTEIIYDAGKRRWILPGNAALADIPLRIAQLPFVEFAEAFRLPSDEDDLDGTLQTHDCVVEVGAHGQRFWVRGLYSTSAPVNAALRELCARANITPWRGEIAVIALAKGNKRPFLKRTNPVTTHIAIVNYLAGPGVILNTESQAKNGPWEENSSFGDQNLIHKSKTRSTIDLE
ncbi:hypothetical protein GGX14DRAFT_402486 [Mycena pura]|uniref:Uncharacterized protein n=1 Tax=Mycena pura TaxID=153505 RepID=A0AAD6Y280_9AGAR|nr:hypothetical protein GGX14DRAFT_402486 [Mycena pura]